MVRCLAGCPLFGYNQVHNEGDCYPQSHYCAQWEDVRFTVEDDLKNILDINDYEEDEDDSIEDPSVP